MEENKEMQQDTAAREEARPNFFKEKWKEKVSSPLEEKINSRSVGRLPLGVFILIIALVFALAMLARSVVHFF